MLIACSSESIQGTSDRPHYDCNSSMSSRTDGCVTRPVTKCRLFFGTRTVVLPKDGMTSQVWGYCAAACLHCVTRKVLTHCSHDHTRKCAPVCVASPSCSTLAGLRRALAQVLEVSPEDLQLAVQAVQALRWTAVHSQSVNPRIFARTVGCRCRVAVFWACRAESLSSESDESSPLLNKNLTCVGSQGSADLAEVEFSSATAPTMVQLQELQRTTFEEALPARIRIAQRNRVSVHAAP